MVYFKEPPPKEFWLILDFTNSTKDQLKEAYSIICKAPDSIDDYYYIFEECYENNLLDYNKINGWYIKDKKIKFPKIMKKFR